MAQVFFVKSLVEQLAASGLDRTHAVASLAEAIARAHGTTLRGRGLRLDSESAWLPELGGVPASPHIVGEVYEQLQLSGERRDRGAFYTPIALAQRLVAVAVDDWARWPEANLRVVDPTVGGGAFLLAAAQSLFETHGGRRRAICERLCGQDIDATAAAVTETVLALWCIEGGEEPDPLPSIGVADALVALPDADLVIGNPPFLNQLGRSTARSADRRRDLRQRFGDDVGPYADSAGLFLLAGLDAMRPGGRLLLVQPLSLLANRHSEAIRRQALDAASLVGLWATFEPAFDASVRVCAPLFERSPTQPPRVRRWTGAEVAGATSAELASASSWSPMVAADVDVPNVVLSREPTVGSIATVTAGFRDQYYGFAPFAVDDGAMAVDTPALTTVGMIDPLHLRWSTSSFRYLKRRWTRPVLDREALGAADPALAEWTNKRLVPKVLLATQTRVLEAVADPLGQLVPVTPVVSIEPVSPDDLWRLTALLTAPPLAAFALASRLGSALSHDAIKLSAADVGALALPSDEVAWRDAAAAAQRAAAGEADYDEAIDVVGRAMIAAYRIDDPNLFTWWRERLPAWRA